MAELTQGRAFHHVTDISRRSDFTGDSVLIIPSAPRFRAVRTPRHAVALVLRTERHSPPSRERRCQPPPLHSGEVAGMCGAVTRLTYLGESATTDAGYWTVRCETEDFIVAVSNSAAMATTVLSCRQAEAFGA